LCFVACSWQLFEQQPDQPKKKSSGSKKALQKWFMVAIMLATATDRPPSSDFTQSRCVSNGLGALVV